MYLTNDARTDFFQQVIDRFVPSDFRPHVVLITHLLPDRTSFIDALARFALIDGVISIPYSEFASVKETIERQHAVLSPTLDDLLDSGAVTQMVRSIVQSDFYVIEIGGYFSKSVHEFSTPGSQCLGIVEGTESGLARYITAAPIVPVIGMPLSPIKAAEANLVGESCLFSAERILRSTGMVNQLKNMTVLGFGRVGEALAMSARLRGYEVSVFETSLERRMMALSKGFKVPDRASALSSADIVFGCTGKNSWSLSDIEYMRPGAVLASASSKDAEFTFDEMPASMKEDRHESGLSVLRSDSNFVYVLNDGRPINFRDGADLGFLLTLLQAEMLVSVAELAKTPYAPAVHKPAQQPREKLIELWFEVFVESKRGWYCSPKDQV